LPSWTCPRICLFPPVKLPVHPRYFFTPCLSPILFPQNELREVREELREVREELKEKMEEIKQVTG
jgi:hypothetical protein